MHDLSCSKLSFARLLERGIRYAEIVAEGGHHSALGLSLAGPNAMLRFVLTHVSQYGESKVGRQSSARCRPEVN
jgi:hypothetical protein